MAPTNLLSYGEDAANVRACSTVSLAFVMLKALMTQGFAGPHESAGGVQFSIGPTTIVIAVVPTP